MDKDLAAAPKQHGELPEPVAWIDEVDFATLEADQWCVVHAQACDPGASHNASKPLYTADQLRTAIAAERARTADTHAAYCHSQQQFHDAVAELSTLRQQLERTRPAPLSDERIAKVLRAASDRAGFVTLEAGTPSVYMVDIVRMVERALFEGE